MKLFIEPTVCLSASLHVRIVLSSSTYVFRKKRHSFFSFRDSISPPHWKRGNFGASTTVTAAIWAPVFNFVRGSYPRKYPTFRSVGHLSIPQKVGQCRRVNDCDCRPSGLQFSTFVRGSYPRRYATFRSVGNSLSAFSHSFGSRKRL